MSEEIITEPIVEPEIVEEVLTQEELDTIEAARIEEEARLEAIRLEEERIAEEARLEAIRIEEERLAEIARIEAERVAEEARKQDLKDRYQGLKDHRAAGAALGISNVDLHFKKNIFEEQDHSLAESSMKILEIKDEEQQSVFKSTEYIKKRKSEYKSIEEVIHVILDHGMDSQEFIDLQNERAAIKAKHLKE